MVGSDLAADVVFAPVAYSDWEKGIQWEEPSGAAVVPATPLPVSSKDPVKEEPKPGERCSGR